MRKGRLFESDFALRRLLSGFDSDGDVGACSVDRSSPMISYFAVVEVDAGWYNRAGLLICSEAGARKRTCTPDNFFSFLVSMAAVSVKHPAS
jgi:hypothetical protein